MTFLLYMVFHDKDACQYFDLGTWKDIIAQKLDEAI